MQTAEAVREPWRERAVRLTIEQWGTVGRTGAGRVLVKLKRRAVKGVLVFGGDAHEQGAGDWVLGPVRCGCALCLWGLAAGGVDRMNERSRV